MARRKKHSTFEDIVDIAAMLPWWGGVALALLVWAGLHQVATQPNPAPVGVAGMGAFAGRQFLITLATFGQYVLPAALLIGAATSAWQARRRGQLHADVRREPTRNALESMSWRNFEHLVHETFRRRGFRVEARGGAGPDGGVDLALHVGKDKYLVQCKQWKARSVGVATVRELFGVMAAEGAIGGFVVASGDFTDEAERFAEGRAIELVGTDSLLALIGSVDEAPETAASPACPKCGAAMQRKTARRGANAGGEFWSCSSFPACRGTSAA